MSTTRRTIATALLALSILALDGCAKPQHEALATTTGRIRNDKLTDAQILAVLIGTNQSEVSEAQAVLAKTTNPDVREFATRLVNDHGDAVREAETLAATRGMRPDPSPITQHVEQATRAEMAQIARRTGADLDRQYVRHEVSEHRDLIATIDRVLTPSTGDAEVRGMLEKTRVTAVAHLEHVQRLEAQLPR